MRTVVVAGASVAGVAAAESLRNCGFDGRLVLIDAENERPHDRPPLSKEILTGDLGTDDIELLSEARADELGIELVLGDPATRLDPAEGSIAVGGEIVAYDGAIIATGAKARRPGQLPRLGGVHTLRTIADARSIAAAMNAGHPRVAVIGGGFIGCEVAAAARHRGLEVTIIESADRLLTSALTAQLAEPIARLHRDTGVTIRCGIPVTGLIGGDWLEGVKLADSTVVAADLAVIGVGSVPATDWLHDSGLRLADGVVTDAALRTSAENVYAAGDIARWTAAGDGRGIRSEHWTDARQQGVLAGRNLITDEAQEFRPTLYVWSDQHGRRLQMVGDCTGEIRFLSGGTSDERYVAVSGRDGVVTGAVAFGDARGFLKARRLVARQQSWHDCLTSDWQAA